MMSGLALGTPGQPACGSRADRPTTATGGPRSPKGATRPLVPLAPGRDPPDVGRNGQRGALGHERVRFSGVVGVIRVGVLQVGRRIVLPVSVPLLATAP